MKKTLLTIATLAIFTTTPSFIRAADATAPAAAADAAVKPYPLTTCIVSGDKLGEMGKPITLVYKGQEMKFCCASCPKDFKKNPEKYMKKMAEAQKAEAAKTEKK